MVKGGDGACLWARRFRRAAGDAAVLVVRIWVSLPPGGAASAECSAGHVGLPYLSPRGMRNHPQGIINDNHSSQSLIAILNLQCTGTIDNMLLIPIFLNASY